MKNPSRQSEQILFALRSLYDSRGYSRYKMNKFEEYDLYARNKDFLISDSVITFTDLNGKLMALKPDVTLSIVKNTRDIPGAVQKLYYNENVYRAAKGSRSFKEIMQVGLEAIGEVDDYCIYEVLKLAAESLVCTGKNCILEFSHLGLLSELMDYAGIPESENAGVMHCIGEKNSHELMDICRRVGIDGEKAALLRELLGLYGTPGEVLPRLRAILPARLREGSLSQFVTVAEALDSCGMGDIFRIDFSIVSDIRYYNGFVFRGFAQGIPVSILSGGEYGRMMERMKRSDGAIGFAVYLDMLEQYESAVEDFDVDNLLIYDKDCSIAQIEEQTRLITQRGESLLTAKQAPEGVRYKRLIKLGKDRVEAIENHA